MKEQEIRIDLNQTEAITCDKCGNDKFVSVVKMRLVSAVYSANGEDGILPIATYECSACGWTNDMFLPNGLKNVQSDTDNTIQDEYIDLDEV